MSSGQTSRFIVRDATSGRYEIVSMTSLALLNMAMRSAFIASQKCTAAIVQPAIRTRARRAVSFGARLARVSIAVELLQLIASRNTAVLFCFFLREICHETL